MICEESDSREIAEGTTRFFGESAQPKGAIAKSPAEGAATQLYVATSPALAGVSGAYFEDCNPVVVSGEHHIYDAAMASRLWAEAEKMAADYLV